MTALLFATVLIVVLAITGTRTWRKHRAKKRTLALPGNSEDTALVIEEFESIATEVSRRRCLCSGRFDIKGESSRTDGARRIRVVGIECRYCEERQRLFFDVTRIFN